MDPAMQRRFHVMTEFKALKPAAVEKLAEKFWPDLDFSGDETGKNWERLCRYDSVTPGDFGSLAGKLRFMEKDELTADRILSELCQMQEEKQNCSRRVGF